MAKSEFDVHFVFSQFGKGIQPRELNGSDYATFVRGDNTKRSWRGKGVDGTCTICRLPSSVTVDLMSLSELLSDSKLSMLKKQVDDASARFTMNVGKLYESKACKHGHQALAHAACISLMLGECQSCTPRRIRWTPSTRSTPQPSKPVKTVKHVDRNKVLVNGETYLFL